MNDRSTRAWPRVAATALTLLGVSSALALAQPANPPQQQPPQQPPQQSYPKDAKATDQGAASLTAKLVEIEEYAAHGAAAVEVQVVGLKLTDPATVGEKPAPGQGHIHYQIDDGPIIATTATDLIFHQLKPGPHKLKVMLAANDHSPLGPSQELSIPGDAKAPEGKNASGEHGAGHDSDDAKGKDKDDDEPVAQAKEKPTLTAKLVDEAKNSARKALTVEVIVSGMELVDPIKGGKDGAHVHFALDDGPIVATSMKKLSYHELKPGPHKMKVVLADAHHKPIGQEQILTVTIP